MSETEKSTFQKGLNGELGEYGDIGCSLLGVTDAIGGTLYHAKNFGCNNTNGNWFSLLEDLQDRLSGLNGCVWRYIGKQEKSNATLTEALALEREKVERLVIALEAVKYNLVYDKDGALAGQISEGELYEIVKQALKDNNDGNHSKD